MGGRRVEVGWLTAKAATRDLTSGKSSPGNVCRDNDDWMGAIMAGVIMAGLNSTTRDDITIFPFFSPYFSIPLCSVTSKTLHSTTDPRSTDFSIFC